MGIRSEIGWPHGLMSLLLFRPHDVGEMHEGHRFWLADPPAIIFFLSLLSIFAGGKSKRLFIFTLLLSRSLLS